MESSPARQRAHHNQRARQLSVSSPDPNGFQPSARWPIDERPDARTSSIKFYIRLLTSTWQQTNCRRRVATSATLSAGLTDWPARASTQLADRPPAHRRPRRRPSEMSAPARYRRRLLGGICSRRPASWLGAQSRDPAIHRTVLAPAGSQADRADRASSLGSRRAASVSLARRRARIHHWRAGRNCPRVAGAPAGAPAGCRPARRTCCRRSEAAFINLRRSLLCQ